jgi:aryl-alcohol dehydrogenase-like predicted oxidoreductase
MRYRLLGRTGVQVSVLSLGTGNFTDPTPKKDAVEILYRALDAGINCVDTADAYAQGRAEEVLGEALVTGGRRHGVLISTKVHYRTGSGPNDAGNSRLHIMQACDASLRRLRTDYLDFYLVHRPCFSTAPEETLGTLTDLIRQGKIRYFGFSTHPAWKVMEAVMLSELRGYARCAVEEPPFNLLDRRIENELVPVCETYGVGIFAWSPMAMGILAGRYARNEPFAAESRAGRRGGEYLGRVTPRAIQVGERFVRLAEKHGVPPAQLAVLWTTEQPGITSSVIGPRTLDQLNHVLPVADMRLDPAVGLACDELVPPGTAVADFHNTSGWMKMRVDL